MVIACSHIPMVVRGPGIPKHCMIFAARARGVECDEWWCHGKGEKLGKERRNGSP
jgi:hypothetical protein